MSGFKLFYGAVEWLEFAINDNYDRKLFSELLRNSGKTGSELQMLEKLRPTEEFISNVKNKEVEDLWWGYLELLQ